MLLHEASTRLWRVTIAMKISYKTALLYGAVALASMVAVVLATQWPQGDKSTPIQTERQVGIFCLAQLSGMAFTMKQYLTLIQA